MNKPSKVRARPAAIILTPAAEARIAELMSRAPEGAIGVKLSTPRRGCSGLAYSVDYVRKEDAFDEKIEKAKLSGPMPRISHMFVLTDAKQLDASIATALRESHSRCH